MFPKLNWWYSPRIFLSSILLSCWNLLNQESEWLQLIQSSLPKSHVWELSITGQRGAWHAGMAGRSVSHTPPESRRKTLRAPSQHWCLWGPVAFHRPALVRLKRGCSEETKEPLTFLLNSRTRGEERCTPCKPAHIMVRFTARSEAYRMQNRSVCVWGRGDWFWLETKIIVNRQNVLPPLKLIGSST